MHSWRKLGRRFGWTLIVLVLFSQLATAAYACPYLTPDTATIAQHAMPMDGCNGGADEPQPNLCQSHHDAYSQATARMVVVDVPYLATAIMTPMFAVVLPESSTFEGPVPQLIDPSGSPPLYLVHSNLRN